MAVPGWLQAAALGMGKVIGTQKSITWGSILEQASRYPAAIQGDARVIGPRFLKSFLELYETLDAVATPINYLSKVSSQAIPKVFEQDLKDGEEIEINHPILALLEDVNPVDSWDEFYTKHWQYIALAGNSYWLFEPLNTDRTALEGPPQEISILRPDWVEVIGSSQKLVSGYVFSPGGLHSGAGRTTITLPQSAVIHFKTPSPLDDYYGSPPLAAGRRKINAEFARQQAMESTMRKGGRPDLMMMHDGAMPDEEQIKRINVAWKKAFGGANQAGGLAHVGGAVKDVKILSQTPREMDWKGLAQMDREDIAILLGVRPSSLGYMEQVDRSNAEVSERMDWVMTILPRMIADGRKITQNILPAWGPPPPGKRWILRFDVSRVPVLQDNYATLSETMVRLFAMGVSVSDSAKLLNVPLPDKEIYEMSWLPFSLQPAGNGDGSALPPSGSPGLEGEPDPDEAQKSLERVADNLAAIASKSKKKL